MKRFTVLIFILLTSIVLGDSFNKDSFLCLLPKNKTLDANSLTKTAEKILKRAQTEIIKGTVEILYPYDDSIFPPEIIAPQVSWKDYESTNTFWLISIEIEGKPGKFNAIVATTSWTPDSQLWEEMKKLGTEKKIWISVLGFPDQNAEAALSIGKIGISVSKDPVGAPIFFRDVPLPFIYAYHNMDLIKWRIGDIATSTPPRVVLENMSVCGNCHSFSTDGTMMGMDVDYANDKGAYVIAPIEEETVFNKSRVISWTDFRREDKDITFGLLARISPDGKRVVATLKDMSVFLPVDDLTISQLFFPIKGILVVYDVESKSFAALPGADNPKFVQSSPTWSPDGKTIVFARAPMNDKIFQKVKADGFKTILSKKQIEEFVKQGEVFRYDLCAVPFNDGKGGEPVLLEGASNNGRSNFFPKFSPDGKWIVFTQSNSYMLLQPDSELMIIPAQGGKARKMRCNRSRMNSWHSFSPNGRWLVFASKENTPYTQLFLTHIDENGVDAPPVLLAHFTEPDRAANIPEFVNIKPDKLKKIREEYIDEFSHYRMAEDFFQNSRRYDKAEKEALKALAKNPKYVPAQAMLGMIYEAQGEYEKARLAFEKCVEMAPNDPQPYGHLAVYYEKLEEWDKAQKYYEKALEIASSNILILSQFAQFLTKKGDLAKTREVLEKTIELHPNNSIAYEQFATFLEGIGETAKAVELMEKATKLSPDNTDVLLSLGAMYSRLEQWDKAEAIFNSALNKQGIKAKAYLHLAALYEIKKDLAKAEENYKLAIKDDPTNPEAYFMYSQFLSQQGRTEEARTYLEKTVKEDPSFTDTYLQLGHLLIKEGKNSEAENLLQKALNHASQTTNIRLALAAYYLQEKQPHKAEAEFKKAVENDSTNSHANFLYGSFLFAKGDYQSAKKYLETAVKSNISRAEYFIELGKLYARFKEYQKAEDMFRKAAKKASDTALIHVYLGKLYSEQNLFEQAYEEFSKATEQNLKDPQKYFLMANALKPSTKHLKASITYQKRGLELNPDNPVQRIELGNLLLAANDSSGAIEQYEAALKLTPDNKELITQIENIKKHIFIKRSVLAISILWCGIVVILFLTYGRKKQKNAVDIPQ